MLKTLFFLFTYLTSLVFHYLLIGPHFFNVPQCHFHVVNKYLYNVPGSLLRVLTQSKTFKYAIKSLNLHNNLIK